MVAPAQKLGTGLYTIPEAAMYARIPTQTLSRWVFGAEEGARVVRPEYQGEKFLTFVDFIQALAIRAIRIHWKIPLQKIREAVHRAEDEFGFDYPLARKHLIFLFNGEILIRTDEKQPPVQISGRGHHQQTLKQLVEPYMHDISFDAASGLAVKYEAFRYGNEVIRMDPKQHLGEPFFEGTGYSPRVLWEAVETEGSVEAAAKAYGVSEQQVEVAFRYLDHLELKSAA
jgi:uncharacterized protein (DUF433 family)